MVDARFSLCNKNLSGTMRDMRMNHTDITIVLDRSGSMATVVNDTIGGFNRFLSDQKAAPGTAEITLHQFDDRFETVMNGVDVRMAAELTNKTFVPRGSTALLDAIGRAIQETGNRLATKSDRDRAGKVVFVIITDGEENASREFNREKVFEMIEHQKSKYSWEFVFLGANQDAIRAAAGIGINACSSITYAANAVGTEAVFRSLSSNVADYRVGASACANFSEEDRKKQAEAGA